ncbi:MAG: hypothetical protein DI630_11940 [Gordonia sp. (in: high G+C Gram-positive bacteria)]|nr:MAG: hypothetical protein DI630_11940 [Gordonia sp. (in: high G+C Gram-positive bacteria)]
MTEASSARRDEVGEAVPSAVEIRCATKKYGSLFAVDSVDFSVLRGEIHGLLGQNGAGKSTLMKILSGLVVPDSGEVLVDGREVRVTDPHVAAELGISMVHQHFSLVGPLTVWENVILGDRGRVDRATARQQVLDVGARYGLDVDPDAVVDDLSTGLRQRVEIIKCLRNQPSILVLDEPTSVLTAAESKDLFSVLRSVVDRDDTGVILISHKLDEIKHSCDRVTIMRNGRVVGRYVTAETGVDKLATEMIGRQISVEDRQAVTGVLDGEDLGGVTTTPRDQSEKPVRLRIVDAVANDVEGRPLLRGMSFHVRAGEILGVAGVEGNGQWALGNLFSSLQPLVSGSVEVDGSAVASDKPGSMGRAGVGVIPEDRHDSGCVLELSVAENLIMTAPQTVARHGFMDRRAMRKHAETLIEQFSISTPSPDTAIGRLSGGNQQKVVLARELSNGPGVLVAAQPTRGLDVGAVEYMNEQLREAAERGIAVLLIANELQEILTLATRIIVIHRGVVVGEMDRENVDIDKLGLMMGGQKV